MQLQNKLLLIVLLLITQQSLTSKDFDIENSLIGEFYLFKSIGFENTSNLDLDVGFLFRKNSAGNLDIFFVGYGDGEVFRNTKIKCDQKGSRCLVFKTNEKSPIFTFRIRSPREIELESTNIKDFWDSGKYIRTEKAKGRLRMYY